MFVIVQYVCVCVCVLPVIEVLGYDEVFEVVVYGSLIVLEKCVGVAQTVTGLRLHSSIFQLPRQLQCSPDKHRQAGSTHYKQASIVPLVSYITYPLFQKKHWEQHIMSQTKKISLF